MSPYEDFLSRVQRMDGLVHDLEESTDPAAVAARELAQSIVDLHGAGLARMLAIIGKAGDLGRNVRDEFVKDDLVRSLLLLHQLHPLDLDTRVRLAVEKVLPLASAYGAEITIVTSGEDIVRLRVDGVDDRSTAMATLRQSVEEALLEAAPDVARIEILDSTQRAVQDVSLPIVTLPLVRT